MTMKCTYCKGTDFFEGPSGGMSVNLLCANPECRHWFNLVLDKLEDLDKIEPSDEEKAAKREAEKDTINCGMPRMLVPKSILYCEGIEIFRAGKSVGECYAKHSGQGAFMRFMGWMDAAFDRVQDIVPTEREKEYDWWADKPKLEG